ncbi:MAG: tyrosine-type recombinase/integrase [Lachnospiraceae bacterium]
MQKSTTKDTSSIIPDAVPQDITFADFYRIYLHDMEVRLKPASLSSKRHIFSDKILPFFGSLPMRDITPQHVRKWQSVILRQNYSVSYQQLIDFQLSAIMHYAERYYDIPNPCTKAGHIGGTGSKKLSFWTLEEYELFASHLSADPEAFTAFEILYWTGMRQGELLALTPNDIDIERHMIHITKSYTQIDGKDIISTPKTKKSERDVAIPQFLMDEIQVYIHTNHIRPDRRLFERTRHYLFYKLRKGCEASGVRQIRTHDIRHSHVSLLINAGFSALDIAERVGHESVSTTLDVYAHLFPDQQQILIDRLEVLHQELEEST